MQAAGADFNVRNKDGKTPKDLWEVSSDEVWKILGESVATTTFNREERESIGEVFP